MHSRFAALISQPLPLRHRSPGSSVVSSAGIVTQPLLQDASVTLTARISLSGVSDTKTFPITVKAQMTEADAVAAAKAALAITYASGDSAASVTQNLTRHRQQHDYLGFEQSRRRFDCGRGNAAG
jgi:hypothetical protein